MMTDDRGAILLGAFAILVVGELLASMSLLLVASVVIVLSSLSLFAALIANGIISFIND